METTIGFILCMILILGVSAVCAYLPISIRAKDSTMHLMIAFSAGVFIGILFLVLLPEAIHESEEGGFEHMTVMYAILIGFLITFVIDFAFKYFKRAECDCDECMDYHSHTVTSLSAFVGLSIHACFDGLALATAFIVGEEVGVLMLVAICIHKAAEVFSLSSTFMLSNNKKKAGVYMTAFCLMTPLAGVLSYLLLEGVDIAFAGIAFAFSAGIFMFVTMMDILPEAFHRKNLNIKSLLLLIVGLGVILLTVLLMGPHAH
jgi:Predicted divalent heavy-metal cations transporter